MDNNLPPFKIFSGTKSRYLAEAICEELGVELGKMNIQRFADGEFEVSFEESIRGHIPEFRQFNGTFAYD